MRIVQDISSEKKTDFIKLHFRILLSGGRTYRVKIYTSKALFREYKVKRHLK